MPLCARIFLTTSLIEVSIEKKVCSALWMVAKGWKAVEEIFGRYALIQRCQWHKRENVVDYLPKARQAPFRKVLQRAYEEPTYEGAKRALMRVKRELSLINESAVRSLEEGLEETLTLHRLGLFEKLGGKAGVESTPGKGSKFWIELGTVKGG